MKKFKSHAVVHAAPMNLGQYNLYQGWTIPEDENPSDEGYLVVHGKDTDDHSETWTPKKQFDENYSEIKQNFTGEGRGFDWAIQQLKLGNRVARTGWNGKGMFVVMMPSLWLPPKNSQEEGPKVNDRTAVHIGDDAPLDCQPYLAMYNAQKQWIPGWLASQSDMLCDDWILV